jgi:glycosyltransferase involved in cell wall biosynthesis
MRIVIATVQVPFVRGGAEIHAEILAEGLRAAGHEAEAVAVPFKWYPPEQIVPQMLACRLLDLAESDGRPIDRLIGVKFPAYLIPHPNKVLWVLHQHRPAYDLWGQEYGDLIYAPSGVQVREAIRQADRRAFAEAKAVFAISHTVARRMQKYCGVDARPLYHPPLNADRFACAPAEDYLFFPSRLSPNKRQLLALEALARTRQPVRVRFASSADHPTYTAELRRAVRRLGLEGRAEFLGAVSEDQKRHLYAHALATLYPPVDEDYGYVTLESMLSSKPVLTCRDSGGPLEFVHDGRTGLVAEPTADGLARAMDEVWGDRRRAASMGQAGRDHYASLGITWPGVIERLLA